MRGGSCCLLGTDREKGFRAISAPGLNLSLHELLTRRKQAKLCLPCIMQGVNCRYSPIWLSHWRKGMVRDRSLNTLITAGRIMLIR